MRCPDCNKFVSLDTDGEPEVELDLAGDAGEVTGTVRIVNACQDCGAELTEAAFDVDVDFPAAAAHMADHEDDDSDSHELELEEPDASRTDRSTGKGRGTKTFYGAEADLVVKCSCGFTETQHWSDDIQASHMDSLN